MAGLEALLTFSLMFYLVYFTAWVLLMIAYAWLTFSWEIILVWFLTGAFLKAKTFCKRWGPFMLWWPFTFTGEKENKMSIGTALSAWAVIPRGTAGCSEELQLRYGLGERTRQEQKHPNLRASRCWAVLVCCHLDWRALYIFKTHCWDTFQRSNTKLSLFC